MPNTTNRWSLTTMRDGFADSLSEARARLTALLGDPKSTPEQREAQQSIVSDLTDRLTRINAEIDDFDRAAEEADRAQHAIVNPGLSENERRVQAFASLVRSTIRGERISSEVRAALKDDTSETGGSSFLPKTVSTQIITEPLVRNPLRGHSTYTGISNLEIPRLTFSLDDDDFIKDGETAKEMQAKGATVAFGRNKFKVFCEISETVLEGSDVDLTSYVNNALTAGMAAKEKAVTFTESAKSGEEHMSFYASETAIKTIEANTLLGAIRECIADLEDDYAASAQVCMRRSDYLASIQALANSNATLYAAPPESILGVPVFFCDKAVHPIVGDFSFSHYNYDPSIIYDRDKDVKTGMHIFVITGYFDHQIKLSSAFRIAKVKSD